jgi:putative transposase
VQNLYFDDDLYKDKYRASSARLPGWDYGSNGLYYITICTQNRVHYFGEIVSGQHSETQNSETQNIASLHPTVIGEVAYHNWLDIPKHFSFVELDEFVIMPNHIHGIIFINKPDKVDWNYNKFGAQSQNLGAVMRGYKASVKTYATTNNIEFGWQPRYYDHVIRNEKEYLNIGGYIVDNPQQWLLNGDNADNIFKP